MHAQVESRDTRRDSNPKQSDGDAECFIELRCGQLRVRPDPVHSLRHVSVVRSVDMPCDLQK